MLSSIDQWCHHYFIRPAQVPARGLWSMCELGTASILRVLASGSPADLSFSAHLSSVTCPFLGTAHGGVQGVVSCAKPWCCAGRVTASGRMPPCCRNLFVLLCSQMPKSYLCVNPVPVLVSVREMGQNMWQLIKWWFSFFCPSQWIWVDSMALSES